MTFEEYIKNPQGSYAMSNRQMYNLMYTEKWNNLKVRENGIIMRTLYIYGDNYYVHFKIPSEVVPKFYYDTIIRFYLEKKSGAVPASLSAYDVQFYSNDPSFVYTFAHAFNKHNMFIKDLTPKMSQLALKQRAMERNPKDELGYVKSIYFAFLEIKQHSLFNKARWEGAKTYNKRVWNDTVTHADDKVKDRQEKGAALEKKNKPKKTDEKSTTKAPKETKKPFASPNPTNFGHFKRPDINKTINDMKKNLKKSVGKK